jgi:hypothetical protein
VAILAVEIMHHRGPGRRGEQAKGQQQSQKNGSMKDRHVHNLLPKGDPGATPRRFFPKTIFRPFGQSVGIFAE